MKIDDALTTLLIVIPWLSGIVLSKGFWLTTFAILFPPYAWYMVVERIIVVAGFLG